MDVIVDNNGSKQVDAHVSSSFEGTCSIWRSSLIIYKKFFKIFSSTKHVYAAY